MLRNLYTNLEENVKNYLIFIGVGILALIGISAWMAATPDDQKIWPALASGLVVFSGGIGSLLLRKQRERRTLSAQADSFERQVANDTAAKGFIDALVLAVALLAAIAVFELQHLSLILIAGYLMILLAGYFIRYTLKLRSHV